MWVCQILTGMKLSHHPNLIIRTVAVLLSSNELWLVRYFDVGVSGSSCWL